MHTYTEIIDLRLHLQKVIYIKYMIIHSSQYVLKLDSHGSFLGVVSLWSITWINWVELKKFFHVEKDLLGWLILVWISPARRQPPPSRPQIELSSQKAWKRQFHPRWPFVCLQGKQYGHSKGCIVIGSNGTNLKSDDLGKVDCLGVGYTFVRRDLTFYNVHLTWPYIQVDNSMSWKAELKSSLMLIMTSADFSQSIFCSHRL